MRKKFFFLAALITAAVCNLHAETVTNVKYIDANGAEQTCAEATVVYYSYDPVTWDAGWYVVNQENVEFYAGVTCSGAVHLILADEMVNNPWGNAPSLSVAEGIKVTGSGNSLTIYGQAANKGKLTVNAPENGAGIGGGNGESSSNITINGGTVTASGNGGGAGIGGGYRGIGTITINGGIITATGGCDDIGMYCGAGIGGGSWHPDGMASSITINGGAITATGGKGDDSPADGIGHGTNCNEYPGPSITMGSSCKFKAGDSEHPSDVISNPSDLKGKRYVTVQPGPKVTSISVGGELIKDWWVTFSAETQNFSGDPSITYYVKFETDDYISQPYTKVENPNNYVPEYVGYYTVKAVATYNSEQAEKEQQFTVKGSPQVFYVTVTGDKNTNNELTFTANAQYFSGTPTVTYYIKKGAGSWETLSGNTYTPTTPGNYTVKAEANYDIESAFNVENFDVTTLAVNFDEEVTKAAISARKGKFANVTINRTFNKNGTDHTICLPFSLDADAFAASPLNTNCNKLQKFSSATIENAGQINETLVLTMEDVTTKAIEAGVPYIIAWENTGEQIVNPVFNNVTITTDEAGSKTSEKVTFRGTFVPYAVEADNKGILFVGAAGTLNWPNVGGNINGFRSYFELDLSADSPLRRNMAAVFGSKTTPTGIDSMDEFTNLQIYKLIESGRVVIISNGIRYDLNGNIVK